jgi:phage recombination protein Bet
MTMTLQQPEYVDLPATVVELPATLTREERQRDLIKRTVCKGATDDELDLFMHVCKKTGLDPLTRQIYAIKRYSNAERREVMSFQTSIDGYRVVAERTGVYAGNDDPEYTVDETGAWPITAKATVWKLVAGQRVPFTSTARWTEYVALNKEGNPTKFWAQMPFLMLGKVAEALALRKAFPNDLSGIYTREEMDQADNGQDVAPAKPTAAAPPALPSPEQAEEVNRQRVLDYAKMVSDVYGVDAATATAFVENHIQGKRFRAAESKDQFGAWRRFAEEINDGKYTEVRGI